MRIFVKEDINNLGKKEYNITDLDNIKHIVNVMRKRVGDIIEIVDLNKNAYNAEILNLEPMSIKIKEKIISNESNIEIDIYQGIPKFDKMEYIIQKSIELGVNAIYPLELKRCVVKLKDKDLVKKIDRWNKISESAAKQSKRDYIPKIHNKINLDKIDFNKYDLNIFLDTEAQKSIKEIGIANKIDNNDNDDNINNVKKISIIIGPEGGFADDEREFLNSKANPIKLGPRVLRTETASITILSILQYLYGDF